MKNWDYANLAREAKEHGGPQKFVGDVYEDGRYDGRVEGGIIGVIGILGLMVLKKHTKKQKRNMRNTKLRWKQIKLLRFKVLKPKSLIPKTSLTKTLSIPQLALTI